MITKSISFKGKPMNYGIAGTGLPVILLHGFAEDRYVWQQQVAFLQDSFQLITPEMPGHGQSALIEDFSLEDVADMLSEIIKNEGLQQVALIGHSMGGYATLAFAEKYPQCLKGFGLFHSSAYADAEPKKETRRKSIEFIQANGGAAFLKTATPNLFSEKTRTINPALVESFVAQQCAAAKNDTLTTSQRAMIQRPERISVLQNADVSVLFIIGEHDPGIPVDVALAQAAMPAVSHVHIFHDSAHMGMLEETQKSNEVLKDYLSKL
ncbi:MAG: alpha/beta hydrolase [Niabella sp.]